MSSVSREGAWRREFVAASVVEECPEDVHTAAGEGEDGHQGTGAPARTSYHGHHELPERHPSSTTATTPARRQRETRLRPPQVLASSTKSTLLNQPPRPHRPRRSHPLTRANTRRKRLSEPFVCPFRYVHDSGGCHGSPCCCPRNQRSVTGEGKQDGNRRGKFHIA